MPTPKNFRSRHLDESIRALFVKVAIRSKLTLTLHFRAHFIKLTIPLREQEFVQQIFTERPGLCRGWRFFEI